MTRTDLFNLQGAIMEPYYAANEGVLDIFKNSITEGIEAIKQEAWNNIFGPKTDPVENVETVAKEKSFFLNLNGEISLIILGLVVLLLLF